MVLAVSIAIAQDQTKTETGKGEAAPTVSPARTRRITTNRKRKPKRKSVKPVAESATAGQQPETTKAAENKDEAPSAKSAENSPATNTAEPNKSSEAETEKREGTTDNLEKSEPAPAPAPEKKDPIVTLRDQIEAAETPVEKSRLRMRLVELLIADSKRQDAINELRAISFEEHFDPQGLYNAGNAMARLGDTDGAIGAYKKAIEQKKGRYSRALNNLGVVLLRQGRWDDAHEALMSALRLENFRYAEASYNMGRLYSARGETDLAIREWRRALAVNQEHKAAAQALSTAGVQDRISVASAVKPPSSDYRTSTSEKAPSLSKSERSRSESSVRPTKAVRPGPGKSLAVDPETYDYLQRARTARERDRQEEAVTNYRKVLSRMDGYFAPANLELSYSLINLKRPDEAIAVLVPITLKEGQRYPIAYYHLARLYETRGDLKLAEENFNLAARYYRHDNAQFLLDVSRVREKLGDFTGALTMLEEYLATLEQKNARPAWSDERLASLKQRIAAAQTKP